MVRLIRSASLVALLALYISTAPSANAQLGYFTELASVPTAAAPVELGPGRYSDERKFFIRYQQQGLLLDFKANRVSALQVRHRLASSSTWGAWSYLHQGGLIATHTWSSPPFGGFGVCDVQVAVVGTEHSGTYPFQVIVVPQAQRAFRAFEYNTYDPRTKQIGTLQHTIIVWTGPDGNTALDKPILVVEGIDGSNVNGPEAYYALGSRDGPASLFPIGQAQGADIAILDFGDGGRRIQDNAAVVRQAITLLRSYRTDPKRGLDIVGISMGGVIARYALAKMEQDGVLIGVDRFVSADSPQRGAVISKDLQDRIASKLEPDDWPAGLARPAGRQLLIYNAFDLSSPSAHTLFYNELRALNGGIGYPTYTTNIGVSHGTPDPNPALLLPTFCIQNGLPAYCRRWGRLDLHHIFGGFGGWDYLVAPEPAVEPDIASAGSLLPRDVTQIVGLTSVALGPIDFPVSYEFERFDDSNPTFIPYVSALDIENGVSRFDPPLIALPPGEFPSFHDEVPELLVLPLLRRLGYSLAPPTSVSISGPSSLALTQTKLWRASTPDPTAGYQYNWEYRTFVPSCNGGGGEKWAQAPQMEEAPPVTPASGEVSLRSGPGPIINALPCGEWHDGNGSGANFPYRGHTSLWLDLRVKATGGGGNVTSAIKRVCVGACGSPPSSLAPDGPLAEAQAAAKTGDSETTLQTVIFDIRPNPFPRGREAVIEYVLAETSAVLIGVYDVLGRRVAILVDGTQEAGSHTARLSTSELPAGLYFVRLATPETGITQSITLTR